MEKPVSESKGSRICGLNRSPAMIFRTRPPVIRWNTFEDINYSFIQFLSSISHVILLTPFRVFTTIPNLLPKADNSAIAMQSWPSQKRGASGRFQDIGQVSIRNFDWLLFIPLWSPSPVLQCFYVTIIICQGYAPAGPRPSGTRSTTVISLQHNPPGIRPV
jgi:hypothetical protein